MKTTDTLKNIIIIGFAALLIKGCVYSIHPLFDEEDLIFTNELLGTWKSNDSQDTWIFEKGSGNTYDVMFISDADTSMLKAGLGKLEEQYYLDFTLGEMEGISDLEAFHLFPTHTFSRVTLEENRITLSWFATQSQWLENLIKEKRIRIKHELANDQVLLTASTDELQKFVAKYADEPKAFDDPEELNRVVIP